jgi:hypothetical protein
MAVPPSFFRLLLVTYHLSRLTVSRQRQFRKEFGFPALQGHWMHDFESDWTAALSDGTYAQFV